MKSITDVHVNGDEAMRLLNCTMMFDCKEFPRTLKRLIFTHHMRPKANINAFRGLSQLLSLRCLDITNVSSPLEYIDGIDFPPNITCLSLSTKDLDASLLPFQLKTLKVENTGDKLTLREKFPSSMMTLKMSFVSLDTDLNHFHSDSHLESLILSHVSIRQGTSFAHLPRGVKFINLDNLRHGPLYVVDCPPELRTFRAVKCDHILHKDMSLPSSLRSVTINIQRMERLPASLNSLILEGVSDPISVLPSGIQFLSINKDQLVSCKIPAFFCIRENRPSFSNVDVDSVFGPVNWIKEYISNMVHYRPPLGCCDLCHHFQNDYHEYLRPRLSFFGAFSEKMSRLAFF